MTLIDLDLTVKTDIRAYYFFSIEEIIFINVCNNEFVHRIYLQ